MVGMSHCGLPHAITISSILKPAIPGNLRLLLPHRKNSCFRLQTQFVYHQVDIIVDATGFVALTFFMDKRTETQSDLLNEFSRLLQDHRIQIPYRIVGKLLGISRGHVHNLLNKEYRLRANTRTRISLFNQCLANAIERSPGSVRVDELRDVVRQMLEELGMEYQIRIDFDAELVLNFQQLVDSVSESQSGSDQPECFTIVAPLDADDLLGKSIKGTAIWLRMMLWLKGVGAEIMDSDQFEDRVLIGARQWPRNVIFIGGNEVDSESHHRINEVLEATGQLELISSQAFFKLWKLGDRNYWLLTGVAGDALHQAAEWLLTTLVSPIEQLG